MQQCHFFPNPMIEPFIFKPSRLEKTIIFRIFFYLGFTPCKDEQPLNGIELQEEEEGQKD